MPPEPFSAPADLLRDALRCEKAGDINQAASLLVRVLGQSPDDRAALAAGARVAGRRRDAAGALACLRRLVALEPKQRPARLDLAVALFGVGDFPGAEAECRTLLAEEPRDG